MARRTDERNPVRTGIAQLGSEDQEDFVTRHQAWDEEEGKAKATFSPKCDITQEKVDQNKVKSLQKEVGES
jgi:hypothetical protein